MAQTWQARWAELEKGLDNSELDVMIGEPSIQGKSMSSRHISYRLTTKSKGYVVQRRFSDFVWLRQVLCQRFPGLFIPSLPPKDMVAGMSTKGQGSDSDPKSPFVLGRLQLLRFFLEGLLRIPFVRGDPSVSAFLTMQDQEEFSNAKEQTAKITWTEDLSEGTVAWREGVSASSPQNWDRIINDFKVQLDQCEKDAKALRSAADSYVEALGVVAVASGKVFVALETSLKSEESFADKSKFEFPNKDPTSITTKKEGSKLFEKVQRADLCQPDNIELILKAAARYEINQVVAFREYLKVREAQNNDVMKHTAILDKHLEDQRNGKPLKAGGGFFSMASKQAPEEIIAQCQADLEDKTKLLNMMTSALEFSEVDRFNSERSQQTRHVYAMLAQAQRTIALTKLNAWEEMMNSTSVAPDEAFDRMIVGVPLMHCFKKAPPSPMVSPIVTNQSHKSFTNQGAAAAAVPSPPSPGVSSPPTTEVRASFAFHAEEEARIKAEAEEKLATQAAQEATQAQVQAGAAEVVEPAAVQDDCESDGSFDGGV